ncbi:MAG TPA: hypothetical protein K8V05_13745 [Butyricimonas virosa]|uniref:Uncharacterized protein n=1 Tax=Butyricimonas virosa TaxID=544645 RepID=A0A921KZH4_9BACT|nr:hypothetical protein [Butyricimonas virosa]
MAEKREYVRQVVAYANYFKDFKKTLSRNTLRKIYQIYIIDLQKENKSQTSENKYAVL